MVVSFSSDLDPQGVHLVLPKLNSLQYKLASPNPTSLSMAILASYRYKSYPAPSPALAPSPSDAPTPTQTQNTRAAGVHNDLSVAGILLLPGCNLRTYCVAC